MVDGTNNSLLSRHSWPSRGNGDLDGGHEGQCSADNVSIALLPHYSFPRLINVGT